MPPLTNSEKGKSDLNIISASVMCIDMLNFRDQLRTLDDAGIDLYHIDVMDGHFVPNYALSPCTMRDIAKVSSTAMDVHLMVDNPDSCISAFADAGASIITPHLETLTHPIRTLKLIRSLGKKAGIAINPCHRHCAARLYDGFCGPGLRNDGRSRLCRSADDSFRH